MRSSIPKSDHSASFLKSQLALFGKHQLRTNDIVEIIADRRMVRINGVPLFGLKSNDLDLLLVLALESPSGLPLTAKEIMNRIEAGALPQGFGWKDPQPEQIYNAVWRLRTVLGRNEDLIEKIQGLGYRLSTPHVNVLVTGAGKKKRARSARKPASMQGSNGNVVSRDGARN